jgi:hypothetical protein
MPYSVPAPLHTLLPCLRVFPLFFLLFFRALEYSRSSSYASSGPYSVPAPLPTLFPCLTVFLLLLLLFFRALQCSRSSSYSHSML